MTALMRMNQYGWTSEQNKGSPCHHALSIIVVHATTPSMPMAIMAPGLPPRFSDLASQLMLPPMASGRFQIRLGSFPMATSATCHQRPCPICHVQETNCTEVFMWPASWFVSAPRPATHVNGANQPTHRTPPHRPRAPAPLPPPSRRRRRLAPRLPSSSPLLPFFF